MGCVWDVLGSALHGLIFASSGVGFHRTCREKIIPCCFGNNSWFPFGFVCTVNKDFQAVESEAQSFNGGRSSLLLVLVWVVITFQLGILGGTAIYF